MKNIISILLVSMISFNSWSQEGNCGTPQNVPNNVPSYQISSGLQDACPIYVNVKFHIVNYSNGTGGILASDVNTMLNILNSAYNIHKIYFTSVGTDIINDDNLANFSNTKFNTLANTNRVANAINLYVVPTANGEYRGRAENIPSIALVIDKAYYNLSTLPHEMGHCLNLFHTHHGVESGGCIENIDGSNCASCGDFICDTPADPVLSGNVNLSCVYTGNSNQNGVPYNPDTRNIMSYSNIDCRNRFSIKQGERMYASLKSLSLLQSIVNQTIFSIAGPSSFCTNAVYSINAPTGATITWSASPAGIVTLSTTSGLQTTLTKIGNGNVILTASVTNDCGTTNATKLLVVGSPVGNIIIQRQGGTCYYQAKIGSPQTGVTYQCSGDCDLLDPGQNYSVSFTMTNACGSSTIQKSGTAPSAPSGCMWRPVAPIEKLKKIQVYPNPAHTNLHVNLPDSIDVTNAKIIIRDITGKKVSELLTVNKINIINIENLNNGTYTVEIIDNKRRIIKKIVKY